MQEEIVYYTDDGEREEGEGGEGGGGPRPGPTLWHQQIIIVLSQSKGAANFVSTVHS